MDEFNNNGGQGENPITYGQASNGFSQPVDAVQFGGNEPNYGQPQPNQGNVNQEPEQKGLSIAAMVLGILSMTCCCGGIGVFMGIAAIIMGVIGKKKGGRGMGIAGIVCGSIGVIVSILYLILYTLGVLSSYESYL